MACSPCLCFFLFQKYRGIDAIAFSALTYGRYLYDGNFTQLYAIATSIPILLYNGKRGAVSLKYFFYIIYPRICLFCMRSTISWPITYCHFSKLRV